MSRPAFRRTFRLRVALIAGAVLSAATLVGATSAQATPNVTDLEGTILRIGGTAVTGSNPIPSGRSLTPVRLTTADPVTGANDGVTLGAGSPSLRIRGTVVPGSPAEEVTLRVDGSVVATTVPQLRLAALQTDAGQLTALVFTASGVTYAIPQRPAGAVTRTVAQSAVNTTPVSTLLTYRYGLLPVGAQPQVGTGLTVTTYGSTTFGTGTSRFTVLDADSVRGNSDAPDEELVALGGPAPSYGGLLGVVGTEVSATVTLNNGATATVRGLRHAVASSYGEVRTTWFFDRAALAAAGGTVEDVTGVVSFAPVGHDLTWQELGFDVA